MILSSQFRIAPAALALLGLAAVHPQAASAQNAISFGAVQTLSGDADVSTAGTLYKAYVLGSAPTSSAAPSNTTVNGVTFVGAGAAGGSNFVVTGATNNATNQSSGAAPFSSLSPAYRALLQPYIYGLPTLGLALSGLTAGHQYQFQIFVDDPRSGAHGRTMTVTDGLVGGGTSGPLQTNTTGEGGLGQFVLGTFTAGVGGTENITLNGGTPAAGTGFGATVVAQINAFQVRDLSAAPEPSQCAAFALGIFGLSVLVLKARRRSVV